MIVVFLHSGKSILNAHKKRGNRFIYELFIKKVKIESKQDQLYEI